MLNGENCVARLNHSTAGILAQVEWRIRGDSASRSDSRTPVVSIYGDYARRQSLPAWFEIDRPVGKYNPDWAILKHDNQTLYLVRETQSTKDFLKLRTSEADKVRCGKKHFETLGVPFAVVVSADEV